MSSESQAASPPRDVLARAGPWLALLLLPIAYRPLFLHGIRDALPLPGQPSASFWFFRPDQISPILVIGIAGWLLWRRRERLRSLPAACARAATAVLVVLGTVFFVWAHLTRTPELLLPSLALHVLALAAAMRGGAGCRAVSFPALVLLLGLPLPGPLHHELVWALQVQTAAASFEVMQALGYDVSHQGIELYRDDLTFVIIETCSGLRGIQILTLVSLAVRELFAHSGARQWLLVPFAPLLAFALNVVRVVVVATSDEAVELAGDHTPQGLAVLIGGTVVLYAAGLAMSLLGRGEAGTEPTTTARGRGETTGWGPAVAWLAVLGIVSVATPTFPDAPVPMRRGIPLAEEREGWTSKKLPRSSTFLGALPQRQALHRRYERERRGGGSEVVELLVVFEVPGNQVTSRLFSSRLSVPSGDWSPDQSERMRLFLLGLDADVDVLSRDEGSSHALVYTWRVRDEGLLRESSRSLLALDKGPFRRERARAAVRLATPLARDDSAARSRAEETLDRFIMAFRDDLAAL